LISIPKEDDLPYTVEEVKAVKGSSVGAKSGKEQLEESYATSKRHAVSIAACIKLKFSLCIVETLALFVSKILYV
jgi:hypothetical protein